MNATIRTGITEAQDFYLKEVSNLVKTAIDLTNAAIIVLYLKSHETGTVDSFSSGDSKVEIVAPATDGRVRWNIEDGDVATSDMAYDAYFMITDNNGKKFSVPTEGNFIIDVIEGFSGA